MNKSDLGRLVQAATCRIIGWSVPTQEPTFTGGTPEVTSYTYDAVGNLYTVTPPNGVVTTYTYDALNRLDRETVTSGATTLADYDYFLLADGQRDYVTETDAAGVITKIDWTYDTLNRLVGEARDVNNDGINGSTDYSDTYTLDRVGNRLGKLHDAPGSASDETISYVYNPNDQLTTETSSLTGATTYAYDENGSQISVTSSTGTKKYTWDLRNRMVAIDGNGDDLMLDTLTGATSGTVNDSSDTNFTYDSSGVRTSEATAGAGGSTTYFLNDPQNPTGYTKAIEESTVANGTTSTRSYVLGNKVEAQSDSTNGVLYLLTDGHGSTRALTNVSGSVIERYDYDAFGTTLASGTSSANAKTTWLFGGDGIYDSATGWTYHLARWRDGFRFVSYDSFEADPGSPVSLHKFLYAHGDPVSGTDPSGEFTVLEVAIVASIILVIAAITIPAIIKVRGKSQLLRLIANVRDAIVSGSGNNAIDRKADALAQPPSASFPVGDSVFGPVVGKPSYTAPKGTFVPGGPGNGGPLNLQAFNLPYLGPTLAPRGYTAFVATDNDDSPVLVYNRGVLDQQIRRTYVGPQERQTSDMSKLAIFVQEGWYKTTAPVVSRKNWVAKFAGSESGIKENSYYMIDLDVRSGWSSTGSDWKVISRTATKHPQEIFQSGY